MSWQHAPPGTPRAAGPGFRSDANGSRPRAVDPPGANVLSLTKRLVKTHGDPARNHRGRGRRAILAHLEAFGQHYPHLFVYLRETEDLKRRFRAATQLSPKQYERFWQQILREGMKSGEFRPDLDVQVTSYGLLGMLNWLYKWYDPRGRLGVRDVAEQFASLALAGLAGNGAKRHPVSARRRR